MGRARLAIRGGPRVGVPRRRRADPRSGRGRPHRVAPGGRALPKAVRPARSGAGPVAAGRSPPRAVDPSEAVTALAEGPGPARRPLPRSSAFALAVVTILLVAGIGYVGLKGFSPSSVVRRSCAPSSSPSCAAVEGVHDLSITVPVAATTVGAPVPFTAVAPP